MKYIDNLDRGEKIEDQLEGYAVAVNHINPKPEDYDYKFSELKPGQQDLIRGMAIAVDEVDILWGNKDFCLGSDNEPEPIRQIRESYQEKALVETQGWIIMRMDEMMVSFGDKNYCEGE